VATIVMVVTGTAGDIHPLIAIGGRLTARGHRCTLITHAPFAERACEAGLKFVALDTAAEYQRLLESSAELVARDHDVTARAQEAGWYHDAERSRFKFDEVVRRVDPGDTLVVARYVTESDAVGAAERAGARAAWSLVSPHAVSEAQGIEQLHGETYRTALNAQRRPAGLEPVGNWLAWMEATPRLGLWPAWFAPDLESVAGLSATGFPAEAAGPVPRDVWQFLSEGAPPVLVTAGSGMMLAPAFYRAAVEGCVRAGRRVIVLGGDPEPWSGAGGQVRHWRWLPLAGLVPQVAAVVHHGGIGTVAQCLAAGSAQLILAQGVDRPDNAARVERLGTGAALPPAAWRPAEVASAMRRLLDDPAYQVRAKARAATMRADDGVARACDTIEELVKA
jgi:rhamnosyltransferase subunit B